MVAMFSLSPKLLIYSPPSNRLSAVVDLGLTAGTRYLSAITRQNWPRPTHSDIPATLVPVCGSTRNITWCTYSCQIAVTLK